MATKFETFSGKAKWTKVYKGQEDQKYGHYGLNFYPDDVDAFQATGIQLQPKMDDDGTWFQLRRKPKQLIKNEVVDFGTPTVIDAEGNAFDKPIGNGSTVTVKVAVYDTQKGKGHRLEAVRVEQWVEYKKPEEVGTGAATKPKFPF